MPFEIHHLQFSAGKLPLLPPVPPEHTNLEGYLWYFYRNVKSKHLKVSVNCQGFLKPTKI